MYACARQYEKEIFDFVFEHWEGISLGWAQEGLSQNRPATTRLRMDTIESLSAWIIFMRGIFGFYIVRAQRCLWCFKFNARHNWRQDIVTHIVTTYASRYKQRLRNDTIENLSAWIIFMCGIFGFYIVRAQRCLWYSKFIARHNWRQDIVVPIVTTYASCYKQRLRNDTIVWIYHRG